MKRQFANFFRWEYLVMLLIIGILLIPMSIGLYRQYDLHPEKIMYGQQGISGLRFFYWTQSFGRITGESTWHENDHFLFLFENLLWGFLPWTVFFILSLAYGLREWLQKKFFIGHGEEAISLGGFLITYCALGSSRAQLPHYIYVVLPLAAIFTGKYLDALIFDNKNQVWLKPLTVLHNIIFSLMIIIMFGLLLLPFPPNRIIMLLFVFILTAIFLYTIFRKWILLPRLLTTCVLTVILINTCLDTGFYPKLLEFQAAIPVSRFIRENQLNKDRIFLYWVDRSRSLDFYSNYSFVSITYPDSLREGDYLLTTQKGMETINRTHFRIIDSGLTFHVSTLSLPVLNPATRKNNSDAYYLMTRF
jgi:hypothetical protein